MSSQNLLQGPHWHAGQVGGRQELSSGTVNVPPHCCQGASWLAGAAAAGDRWYYNGCMCVHVEVLLE